MKSYLIALVIGLSLVTSSILSAQSAVNTSATHKTPIQLACGCGYSNYSDYTSG